MLDNGSGMNILYISYIYYFFLWLGHPTLMFLLLAKNANAVMQGCITRVMHDFFKNSFVIPKYYTTITIIITKHIHAQTEYTPISTGVIPQSPHKVCLLLFYKCYSKKKKLIIFVKEEKLTRLQSPFVH